MAISRQEQMAINRAVGQSFEDACVADLKANGFTVKRSVKISYAADKCLIADVVAYSASGAPEKIIEIKSSATASFTPNQKEGYPIIASRGGTLEDGTAFPKVSAIAMYPDGVNVAGIKRLSL